MLVRPYVSLKFKDLFSCICTNLLFFIFLGQIVCNLFEIVCMESFLFLILKIAYLAKVDLGRKFE